MRVKEIATSSPRSCDPGTNLAAAAWIMWENDCGVVPVVDRSNRAIGMLTDRDICMALATRRVLATDITAGDVINGRLVTCRPEDDVRAALKAMADNGVRRLPVVNEAGVLQGMLSVADILLAARAAKQGRPGDPTCDEVSAAMAAICRPRQLKKEDRPKLVIAGT